MYTEMANPSHVPVLGIMQTSMRVISTHLSIRERFIPLIGGDHLSIDRRTLMLNRFLVTIRNCVYVWACGWVGGCAGRVGLYSYVVAIIKRKIKFN